MGCSPLLDLPSPETSITLLELLKLLFSIWSMAKDNTPAIDVCPPGIVLGERLIILAYSAASALSFITCHPPTKDCSLLSDHWIIATAIPLPPLA